MKNATTLKIVIVSVLLAFGLGVGIGLKQGFSNGWRESYAAWAPTEADIRRYKQAGADAERERIINLFQAKVKHEQEINRAYNLGRADVQDSIKSSRK